jgi:hypothetical protein
MIRNAALDIIPSFLPILKSVWLCMRRLSWLAYFSEFLGCVPIGLNIVGILEVRLNVNNSAICNKTHLEDIHHHLTSMTISRLKRGEFASRRGGNNDAVIHGRVSKETKV